MNYLSSIFAHNLLQLSKLGLHNPFLNLLGRIRKIPISFQN